MNRSGPPVSANTTVPLHERHFYATTQAFGRFGIRTFVPQVMAEPHWHGHIELNFCASGMLVYNIDGEVVRVPPDEAVIFWAGVPHQLVGIEPVEEKAPRLTNMYLPVDAFLTMPHVARLQVALLSGAMVRLTGGVCPPEQIARWYRDYRTGDFERIEVIKMELNALMRRLLLDELVFLRQPLEPPEFQRTLSSAHIRHVIEMVRFVVENLAEPMTNADITRVTGLHENYALTLFTRTMRLPLKKFVTRLRLLRARGLLTQSSVAIGSVATQCGFTSVSQFYQQFKAAYGLPPNAVREQYVRMELR
jgi:AraC-like DNA-binding protein